MALLSLSSLCALFVVAVGGFEGSLAMTLYSYGNNDAPMCSSATTAEECRSTVDQETGDSCVWCECKAIPSECISSSLAKRLPKAVFTCDDEEEKPTLSLSTSLAEQEMWLMFDVWQEKYGVSFLNMAERTKRFAIFKENLAMVAAHNEQVGESEGGVIQAQDTAHYVLGLNRFADMSWEEFESSRLGFGGGALGEGQNCSATHMSGDYRKLGLARHQPPPARRDWRQLGAVSEVKNQAHCGSCWTFSTTGCLESHNYLRNGEMVLLSEQQLVDCAQAFDNHGCSGGLPSHAFEYIASVGGLDTETAYPYVAEESGSCEFERRGIGAHVLRSVNITFQDEEELLDAVGNVGPVSVAFQVASDFRAYAGGVYDNPDCSTSPEMVNHAVLAVGYDTTSDGVDYWIIKNSWGESWGLGGYFHMARGKNMCGVADCAAFPLVP